MRPDQYTDYATIFDLYHQKGRAFSAGYAFLRSTLEYLGETPRVADLGGGTGLLSEHLLFWRPKARLTFVEPSAHMAPIARQRLGERCAFFIEKTFQEASPLPDAPYDALLTVRSLYAMESDRSRYPALFADMAAQLAPGGYLFLMDIRDKLRKGEKKFWEDLQRKLVPKECSVEEFKRMQEIINWTNQEFTTEVNEGRYHLFTREELDKLAGDAGFEPVASKELKSLHRLVYKLRQDTA